MSEINVKIENESDDSSEDEVEVLPQKPKPKKKFKTGQQAECVECKKQKKIASKDMCSNCYQRLREPNSYCITCRRAARVGKEGLCGNCLCARNKKLRKQNTDKHQKCEVCKQIKFIEGHGLCSSCQAHKRAKTNIRMCRACGILKSHHADKMCQQCYNKSRYDDTSKYKECIKCKQTTFIAGHDMCQNYYNQTKKKMQCYDQSRKQDTSKHKKCVRCGQTKLFMDMEDAMHAIQKKKDNY